jgi:hypothetical protein
MFQPKINPSLQLATLLKSAVEHHKELKSGNNTHFHILNIANIYHHARSIASKNPDINMSYIELINRIYAQSEEISKKQFEQHLREYLRDAPFIDDDVY